MAKKKLVRNGKVAILYSPGFGAGWSTWATASAEELLFDPGLVELVEARDAVFDDKVKYKAARAALDAYAAIKWPEVYIGGLDDVVIEWIPQGTRFRINEYDGSESVEILDPDAFMMA